MVEVPVYDMQGAKVGTLDVDEAKFGGQVNVALLKQAVVAYHTNSHQGSAATRSRGQVEGSTRKLYKQKGTGNARRGPLRTNLMRGGGVAFGKVPHRHRHSLSRQERRGALNSAILAKLLGSDLMVVEGLKLDRPRTKPMANLLAKLQVPGSCVLTLAERDDVIYRSTRNLPRVDVRTVAELNAFDVAKRRTMLLTREAMDVLLGGPQ
jgi:large subunit ribosomal protein L4